MLRLLIVVSLHARNFLRCYMPTNILADAIRARRGMKWGPAVMLLAVPYFTAAIWLAGLIDRGAPGWLHLVVLLTICYAVVVVMPMMLGRSRSAAVGGLRLSA